MVGLFFRVDLENHIRGYAEVPLILEIGYDTHLHIIRKNWCYMQLQIILSWAAYERERCQNETYLSYWDIRCRQVDAGTARIQIVGTSLRCLRPFLLGAGLESGL